MSKPTKPVLAWPSPAFSASGWPRAPSSLSSPLSMIGMNAVPGPSLWREDAFQSFLIIQHWAAVVQTWQTVYRDEDNREGRWMKNTHTKESKIEKERIKVPLRSEETSEVPTYSKRPVCLASTGALIFSLLWKCDNIQLQMFRAVNVSRQMSGGRQLYHSRRITHLAGALKHCGQV